MTATDTEKAMARGVAERTASDLGLIIDRELAVQEVEAERRPEKATADGVVNVAFRLEFERGPNRWEGCALFPLPEAIAIASYLMVLGDEEVAEARGLTQLDRSLKDAMMEIGTFIGGSADAVLRSQVDKGLTVRSVGCQGVAPGEKPNFLFLPDQELLVARVGYHLHDFDGYTSVWMFPAALQES